LRARSHRGEPNWAVPLEKRNLLTMRPTLLATVLAVVALTGAGCGGQPADTASPSSSSPSSAGPTGGGAASPAASPTATQVQQRLQAAVPTASSIMVYDETNDPNKLLGRPGGYTSKTAFADSRIPAAKLVGLDRDALERGGSVEVYSTPAAARTRSDYIQSILQGASILGTEYHYLSGGVLMRVTGVLPPSQAQEYEAALI